MNGGLIFTILLFFGGFYFTAYSNSNIDDVALLLQEKKYHKAAIVYENYLMKDSINSSVYFNLGHCYFLLGKYGMAMWAYEKTLKYNPRDRAAISSLKSAYQLLKKTEPWESSIPEVERVLYSFGSNFWSYLSLLLSCFFSIIVYLFFTTKRLNWRKVHLLVGGSILLFLSGTVGLAFGTNNYFHSSRYGVVVSKSIPTYGDEIGVDKLGFQLMEGDRIHILRTLDSRYIIELTSKEICFVDKNGVKRI
jgi:tetratricopeptide (TPR) repeat protein